MHIPLKSIQHIINLLVHGSALGLDDELETEPQQRRRRWGHDLSDGQVVEGEVRWLGHIMIPRHLSYYLCCILEYGLVDVGHEVVRGLYLRLDPSDRLLFLGFDGCCFALDERVDLDAALLAEPRPVPPLDPPAPPRPAAGLRGEERVGAPDFFVDAAPLAPPRPFFADWSLSLLLLLLVLLLLEAAVFFF